MKTGAMSMFGVLILAGGLSAQKAPGFLVQNGEAVTGEITDSVCAEGHSVQVSKARETVASPASRSTAHNSCSTTLRVSAFTS